MLQCRKYCLNFIPNHCTIMKKLLTILFSASILFITAACEDPGEELLQPQDDMIQVNDTESLRLNTDYDQTTD